MKKISLKDVKNGLKRDEMRMIVGGCGVGNCVKSCLNDSDCSCNPCNTVPHQRCATFSCQIPGGTWTTRRACSCP